MSDFINSAVNTKVYNKMQDEHQIISIIDKEVIVKDIGTIVSGDTNSCLLSFEINRFQDGVDLCDKKIRFNYKNTNGIFYDIAVNVKYNDTTIRFSWLLPYSLTQPGGKSIASIEFYGYNEYDEQYSYKTKNFRLSIEKSIGITDESNKSNNNWVIQIENDVESIQNKIIEIEKDIKSINIPTKLSELQGDSEHRTVTDSQISTWNNFEKNVQADWDEKDDKSDAFIKNKPDIPKVTNDLTDELKQLYDDAVIKKHTHMNNSVLDKITQNDIDTWNNKSEFDGNYSSLDNIPENLATEEYVDEKLSGKANDSELSVVAKSGSYNDLEDKPVPYDDTILSNRIKTIEDDYVKNADIPVNISELTNDNNYQTADDVAATLSTTLKAYAKSSDITNEINAEITKVVAGAPESLDTLKELSDWILSHENDASAMNSAILDNKSNITSLQDNKVDKVSGKGLSTNDFTTGEKEKLAGLSNYDDSEIKNSIQQNANNIATKLNKNQGAANSGKIVGINDSGDIVPMFSQGLTYNEDTQCLEFGADEKLNLNSGIQLDETLSKTGYAADAAKVGETVSELKSDLADITYTIYPTNIYDQTVALNGERLQSNGNTYKTSDYFTSGYIDVSFVGNVTLFFGTGNYALNSYAVAFYDASKNYIDGSYISTVANNVHMYNGAKYMRFSAQAQYYPAERNVHVSYGTQRASSYTPYFEPKKTIFTDEFYKNVSFTKDIIVCGYSKNDMNIPTFDLSQSQKVVVNVGQYVGILSPSTGFENVTIYNSTPTEFTLGQEEMLVFDKKEKVLKIIPIRSYAESVYYIPLLITGKNAILYGGQWLGCALWQMVGNNYKEQKLPFSPRKFKRAASNNAGDQSMCLCHEYYICVDAQDSDGFIKVVNKDDYSLVKVISHTLGHAGWSSYDEPSDSLLISNEDVSYIIEHFYENIGNTTSLNSTNCIVYNANIGTFIDGYNTIATVCGTADTLNNVTLVRYSIDRNGNFSEVSRYKGNYRLPVMQDIKYHNGCLYVSCGFKKVVIYKIQLFSSGDYEVVDAYNIAEDIYEQEGLIIDMDKMVLSVREATAITNKYFIETEFTN